MTEREQGDGSAHAQALGRSVRTVSGMTLMSRVAGLARDLVTARVVGDSALGSAFMAAFVIPNTFRRLFGEGALAAAFLPLYTRTLRGRPGDAAALAAVVLRALIVVTGALTALGEVALLVLVLALPQNESRELSFVLMMMLLPFMPLICVTAILGAMLQAHGRFAVAAAAPVLLNLLVIGAAVPHFAPGGPSARTTTFLMAGASVLAAAGQAAWSWAALRGLHAPRPMDDNHRNEARRGAREVLRRFTPVVIGMGALQLNTLIDTLIAMWPIWVGPWVGPSSLGLAYPLDAASNAVLGFTQRLYQFPLGVFGIAVATAVFPALSRDAGDGPAFAGTLARGLRLSLFIGLPASAGLVLVRDDLLAAMYGGGGSGEGAGGFSGEGVARAAAVLLGYAPAVWAYSLNHVLARAHYALGDTRTPMRISLGSIGINLALNLTLIWSFREAGMAWATAIAAMAQTVLLALALPAEHRQVLRSIATHVGILACLTAGMSIAVWGAERCLPGPTGWLGHVTRLAVSVAVGGGAYVGLAIGLRRPELRWLIGRRIGGLVLPKER